MKCVRIDTISDLRPLSLDATIPKATLEEEAITIAKPGVVVSCIDDDPDLL